MKTRAGSWNGQPATAYEAGGTRVVVVPSRGAKIVSLVDPSGEEWLLQAAPARATPYHAGTAFTDAEMCGWDECAPTIEAAPTGIGTTAPDHGELWDAHWVPAGDGGFSGSMPSIGAQLTRWVTVADDGAVDLHYRATHLGRGDGSVPLLWAAHPMFVLRRGDRISAGELNTLWDVSTDPPSPVHADAPTWCAGDSTTDHVLNRPRPAGSSVKFYADPLARPSWARLSRADRRSLTLSWSPASLPYLGIWIDRTRFARADVVAFEPSTGWFDSVERANRSGHVLRLPAGGSAEWSLSVRFDSETSLVH